MTTLKIYDVAVRQDADGRYCLNDLHRASGGAKRHQPSDWLRLQQTQELVAEVDKSIPGIPGIQSKQGLGTFAVEELVIAYASWISPAFHLRVIRTFRDTAMGSAAGVELASQPQAPTTLTGEIALLECFGRLMNVSDSGKLALLHKLGENHGLNTTFLPRQAVDAPLGSNVDSSEPTASVSELLKKRGGKISARKFNLMLEQAGFLRQHYRNTTSLDKYPDGRKAYWAITQKGLPFGKNVVDAECPRETKPVWFTASFDALCRLVWAETREPA